MNPFEGMFNRQMDDFFGPSTSGPPTPSSKLGNSSYLSGYGGLGTGPGAITTSGAYGDDISPMNENSSSRPFSNGHLSAKEDTVLSSKDSTAISSSPSKNMYDNRQRSADSSNEDQTNKGDQATSLTFSGILRRKKGLPLDLPVM